MDQKWTSTQAGPGSRANGEHGIVEQAKETASTVAERAREGVSHQLDVRKDRAVGTMTDVADMIRETSGKLKDAGPLPDLAERAADGIERVARMVESRDLKDVVRSVETFARREPALFLGGALALGLAAGRFLKSSTPEPSYGSGSSRGGSDLDFESYGDVQDRAELRGFAMPDEEIAFGAGAGSVGGAAGPGPKATSPGATQGAPGMRAEARPLGGLGQSSGGALPGADVPGAPGRDPNGTPGRS
jgi:hypothetical protein